MTDVNLPADDDGVDWGGMDQPEAAASWSPEDYPAAPNESRQGLPKYPEYPDNPHNHRFTISHTPGKAPMIVIRGNTAAEMTAAYNELEEYGIYANMAAADASLKAQGQIGAGLGPVTPVSPMTPPPGLPQGPGTPPPFGPNVSVPSAPGYAGPPQPSQYGAPQQQGWAGANGGGYQSQNQRAEAKPQPPGWMRVNARSGPGFDAWKNMREQYKDQLKGKVQWGGKSDYWIDPGIAQWIASSGWAVTP